MSEHARKFCSFYPTEEKAALNVDDGVGGIRAIVFLGFRK